MKSMDIKVRAKRKRVFLTKKKIAKPLVKTVRPKGRWPVKTSAVAVSLVIIVAFLVSQILPEAVITVSARSEAVTRDFEIRVDQNQTEADASLLAVPGRKLEQEISGAGTGEATGSRNVGKTASGFVYLYNFSTTTLILRAQTTVLTANGRRYFFTQDVSNIRPTARIGLEGEEIDPTSLIAPVPVVAEGPGEQFNLSEGTRLEISNEAFGSRPEALYAIASEDITGGSTQVIKIITEDDIERTHAELTLKLVNNAQNSLTEESPGLKLAEGALITEVLEKNSAALPGHESPSFEVDQKIRLTALVYDEAEVESIIKRRVARLLPENKLLSDKDTSLRSSFLAVNLELGQAVLTNHFEGRIVYSIDKDEILDKVRSKTVEEIRDILLSRPEISEVEVKLYPFWAEKSPKFKSKIRLEITNEVGENGSWSR